MKIFFYGLAFVLAILGIYVAGSNLSQWWGETITGWSFIIFVLVGMSSGRGIVRTIKKSAKAKRKAKAKEGSAGDGKTVSIIRKDFLDDFGYDGYDEDDVKELKAYALELEKELGSKLR